MREINPARKFSTSRVRENFQISRRQSARKFVRAKIYTNKVVTDVVDGCGEVTDGGDVCGEVTDGGDVCGVVTEGGFLTINRLPGELCQGIFGLAPGNSASAAHLPLPPLLYTPFER